MLVRHLSVPLHATWKSWKLQSCHLSTMSQAARRRMKIRKHRHDSRMRQQEEEASTPSLFRVALAGCPNVGKSTLFNRLTANARRRGARAICAPLPGTTRDYREAGARIGDLHFELVDTGGLEAPTTKYHKNKHGDASGRGEMEDYGSPAGIQSSMLGLTESVLSSADVVLLLIDGRQGVTSMDEHFAQWIRRIKGRSSPVQQMVRPVVNKMEGWSNDAPWTHQLVADTHRLGFGDPVFISAEHGDGLGDLFDALVDTNDTLVQVCTSEKGEAKAAGLSQRRADKALNRGLLEAVVGRRDGKIDAFDKCKNLNDHIENIGFGGDKSLRGSGELDSTAIIKKKKNATVATALTAAPDHTHNLSENVIQICILGRPNTGKSTLTNALVGENRVLTGPTPGLTRDAVRLDVDFDVAQFCRQHQYSMPKAGIPDRLRIIDTAGVRRPGKRDHSSMVETESVAESMHALKFSHVVAVVLDAQIPPTRMDLALIGMVLDEGRAVVLVANKIDLIEADVDADKICAGILEKVSSAIPQARGAAVVPMSALHKHGIDELLPICIDAYSRWDQRITTAILNQFIAAVQRHTPPPRGAKIQYISQVQHRPPKFVLFKSGSRAVPEHYERFLANSIRDEFDFGGVPIRLDVKAKLARGKMSRKRAKGGKSEKKQGRPTKGLRR